MKLTNSLFVFLFALVASCVQLVAGQQAPGTGAPGDQQGTPAAVSKTGQQGQQSQQMAGLGQQSQQGQQAFSDQLGLLEHGAFGLENTEGGLTPDLPITGFHCRHRHHDCGHRRWGWGWGGPWIGGPWVGGPWGNPWIGGGGPWF